MGLTIHYEFKTSLAKTADIRALTESLRQLARDLPFKEVGDLVEFEGTEADYQASGKDDEHRWLKIQAGQYVDDPKSSGTSYSVGPQHIIAFATFPGDGCEPANFGFCRYPASINAGNRRLATHLDGWRWRSFCKTQYASDPQCGGVENFLRCHLCVVKLLDFAKKTGLIEVEVSDEGGYWEDRDLKKLAETVGEWNEYIAAFAGQFNDAARSLGMTGESAIAGFQNFEHLEANGLERLARLRADQDRCD